MLIPAAVLTWAMPAYFPGWGWVANMQRMVPSPGTPHPLSKLTVGFMKKQYPNLAAEGEGGYKRISRPVMMHGHQVLEYSLMASPSASSVIQELLSSEQAFVGELQFLESHHMKHLDRSPRVPAAVASQKTVIFRNVQDISHFHSRWEGRATCE